MAEGAPPRLARALLRLARGDVRERVRQDLDEEFRTLRVERGVRAARRWYWSYAARSVLDSHLRRRPGAPVEGRGGGGVGRGGDWLGDLHHGVRLLVREPVVSGAMVATMLLSIGAVSAVASLVYGVMLRPLPFPDSGDIVRISRTGAGGPPAFRAVGLPDLLAWRDRSAAMEEIAGWTTSGATWIRDGTPTRVVLAEVTEGFGRVLGTTPAMGRFFAPEELLPGANRVLVLSHDFWSVRLGAPDDVIGRTLTLDGVGYVVVGVLPDLELEYPAVGFDAWTPLVREPDHWSMQVRGASWLAAVGRIRSGTSIETAEQELSAIQARLAEEFPRSQENQTAVRLEPVRDVLVAPARQALTLLGLAVGVILLIAAINLSVLLLTRASRRAGELAVRSALGGSPGRLRRQLVAEALVVTGLGGGLGLLAAPWALDAVVSLYPGGLPRGEAIGLDWTIVVAAGLAMAVIATLAAVAPGLRSARRGRAGLRLSGHLEVRGSERVREWLTGAQVAVSVALLIGAALLLRTLGGLTAVDPGFRGSGVVAFRVAPAPARYPEPRDLGVFYDELTAELEALPSARRVGLANFAPFTSGDWGHDFRVVGEAVSDPEVGAHPANVRITGYGYYDALGIPLVRGRLLDRNDDASGAPVVLLNETAAAEAFPGEEVLGRLVEFEGVTRQIVGVVGDVRHHSLAEAPSPEIHLPVDQMPPAAAWVVVAGRDARPPSISDLRAAVARVDPALALTSFASYDDRLADAVAAERFRAFLVAGLGALAVIIALVGIYGTVSNMVTRRWREIGIRLALGEGRAGVIRCVLGRAGGLVGIGIAAGALVSAGLAGRMAGLLFETDPYDPTIYLAVALLVWLVSLLAGFGPALTASRLDLTEVIRTD